jgi:uncharacterized protein with von Willebrand factor type A (vWA) domain
MSRLAENVMHFARVLRAAGLPVGTDRVLLSLDALCVAGVRSRADLRAVLGACLIGRGEQRPLFDQAFDLFWRDPDLTGRMLRLLLPQVKQSAVPDLPSNRRLAAALFPASVARVEDAGERIELEANLSYSARERLHRADFDTMSADEWAAAQRLIEQLPALIALRATRRTVAAHRGQQLDLRAMLRNAARAGGDIASPVWQRRTERCEPLVVLVDISGSMSRYSRMFLHFVHTLIGGRAAADHRVHAFVFATRLTHITRQLAARDPDHAINAVTRAVQDWSSGTRIAQCLHEFNFNWARRVLSNSPTVLLITDGLEHGGTELLETEAARLARSCRRIIWLNPLLRYAGFEPRAAGIKALLPHVRAHLPVHNLESLEQLIAVLARSTELH